MQLKKFLSEEQGDAWVWLMIILCLGIFGLIYGILDPFMQAMLDEGVNSGIPSEQQSVERNVWKFLPLVVLLSFALWGFAQSQRRRQAF